MKQHSLAALLFTAVFSFFSAGVLSAQTDMKKSITGICIYIDYPDAPQNITNEELEGLMNDMDYQTADVNRSYRRYLYQETRRNLDFEHDIFYYTAPLPSTHYESLQWFDGILLWKDALEAVIAENPDYDWESVTKVTEDEPFSIERPMDFVGAIKSTIIISSKWGPAGLGGAHFPNWTLSNGNVVGTIQGAVLQRPWDATINLFTLCHEAGHTIFQIPDTYDRDGSSRGTGKYSAMSAQGPDVEPLGGPFLYRRQWGYTKEPGPGTHIFTLPADGDTIVVIKNVHDEREFFTLEARKQSTLGNSLFPAPLGLVIWHSDLKVHTGNDLENGTKYEHYKHSIIQSDGFYDLENGTSSEVDVGDIYREGDEFTDTSFPASKWWAGEASGVEVKDIVFLDEETIQVTVVIPELHEDHYDKVPTDDWTVLYETPSQAGFDATKAFDDDILTYYHVNGGSNEPRPHVIELDLGAVYEMNEFYYTANDNYSPPWEGRVNDYELNFSIDGLDWDNVILIEKFFVTPFRQYALFPAAKARYVRFVAYNSHSNDSRTSVAELEFRGVLSSASSSDEHESETANAFDFSPNPTSDYITVEGLKENYFVRIFDVKGRLSNEFRADSDTLIVDLLDFSSGTWVFNVYDEHGNKLASEKIVKID